VRLFARHCGTYLFVRSNKPVTSIIDFYGGIGFHVMKTVKAPTFLRLRLEKYRDCGDGNDYLIMRREGIQEASDSVRADTSRIS